MTGPAPTPAPPVLSPRRVRTGPTGWALLCEAADRVGVPDPRGRWPRPTGGDRVGARDALVAHGLLRDDGAPSGPVRAGMALVATGRVTVAVELATTTTEVTGCWACAGVPAAGVVVRRDARPEGGGRVEVELQLMSVDHLVDEVVAAVAPGVRAEDGRTAGGPAVDDPTAGAPAPRPAPSGRVGLLDAVTAGLASPLDRVVVDGQLACRTRVQVSGPAGTGLAVVVGDGRDSWQLGTSHRDSLTWRSVDASTVRAAVTSALADQLDHRPDPSGVAGGA